MSVRLVNDATALLSMRNSDFDAYSAYGEVIDNSIQADAKNIKIWFDYLIDGGRKNSWGVIKKIAFGDDGSGMSAETVHRCMQLGYSSRYNDRSGIGRFGVGMTLAAINQCKKVEIYSKQKGGEWFYTYIDLDEITSNPPRMDGIPEPIAMPVPDNMKHLVGSDSGTLVIWEKYDRQPDTALHMIDEFRIWTGRTYRKFIWDSIEIAINREAVFAIDPLYAINRNTKFPNDPSAELYEPIIINWKISDFDKSENAGDEADIIIRMSILPEEFRLYQGSGGSKETKNRYIDRNDGISILRNDREVFYGPIPYWPGRKFAEIDRWWGCEISFNAVLDRAFTVKNIKRGAVPTTNLKTTLYEKTKPTIDTILEKVRERWSVTEEESGNHIDDTVLTGHEDAESAAARTTTDRSEIDKSKDKKSEAIKLVEERKKDISDELKQQWITKFTSQPYTISDDNWKGFDFFETNHLGGSDAIFYNKRHDFFKMLYKIIDDIDQFEEHNPNARKLKSLIDLLLISYSKAEAKFEADMQITVEDFIEQLKNNWGLYLSNYLKTWLKSQKDL